MNNESSLRRLTKSYEITTFIKLKTCQGTNVDSISP